MEPTKANPQHAEISWNTDDRPAVGTGASSSCDRVLNLLAEISAEPLALALVPTAAGTDLVASLRIDPGRTRKG